jgi:hypothetical protein
MKLALDIGNVMCAIDMDQFVEPLSREINLSKEDCYHFLSCTQKLQDLGLCNIKDEIRTKFGIKSEYVVQDLVKAWNKTLIPNYSVIKYLSVLIKEFDLDVAIVSNIGYEHINCLDFIFKDFEFFKKAIKFYSCEVGARKPTYNYYQTFLTMHPEFKGAIYVDDLEENLRVGKEMGLRDFQLDISSSSGSALKRLDELKKYYEES